MQEWPNKHDSRGMNKLGLETFWLDHKNVFDGVAQKLIDEITGNMAANFKALEKFPEVKPDPRQQDPSGYLLRLYGNEEKWNLTTDIVFYTEEILALEELKIIYAYKNFEISIKMLLKSSYPDTVTTNLYQWKNLIQFFNAKGVDITQFDHFVPLNELRIVNNYCKHATELAGEIKSIPEFRNQSLVSHILLHRFYERVKPAIPLFIQELIDAIYKDLYEYDQPRLDKMVEGIVATMEKVTALPYAALIKQQYEDAPEKQI